MDVSLKRVYFHSREIYTVVNIYVTTDWSLRRLHQAQNWFAGNRSRSVTTLNRNHKIAERFSTEKIFNRKFGINQNKSSNNFIELIQREKNWMKIMQKIARNDRLIPDAELPNTSSRKSKQGSIQSNWGNWTFLTGITADFKILPDSGPCNFSEFEPWPWAFPRAFPIASEKFSKWSSIASLVFPEVPKH